MSPLPPLTADTGHSPIALVTGSVILVFIGFAAWRRWPINGLTAERDPRLYEISRKVSLVLLGVMFIAMWVSEIVYWL